MKNWKEIGGVALFASTVVLGGCATAGAAPAAPPSTPTAASAAADLRDRERLSTLQGELSARDARIQELQGQLTRSAGTGTEPLFPPDAKPGQCYARVLTPEKYRTIDERVLVKEESESVQIVPARFEDVQERVLVKEATTRIELVPAEYGTVTEQVLIRAASKKIVEVPATYRTVTEQVLDKPAYTTWKSGPATSFSDPVLDQSVTATGEVMCLVEVPATYKTISRSVVDKPAHTREIEVPADYKTVTKQVEKRPATTREVKIPAEYQTVTVRKLVTPARESRTKIPAEYRTVTRTEKVADARLDWQPVLCKVNATRDNVIALQQALEAKGYTVGPIDGVLGRQTLSAVGQYAKAQGIPHGANYVPLDVLKALKITI